MLKMDKLEAAFRLLDKVNTWRKESLCEKGWKWISKC